MSTIKTTNITHGSNSGTANIVLNDTGNLEARKVNGCQRIVLEQFWSPCDGSVIALQDGNHTITDVTATQFATSSYVDCNGSSINYTPQSGTTQVVYEYRFVFAYTSASPIFHFKILVDSDEVTSYYVDMREQYKGYLYEITEDEEIGAFVIIKK